MSVSIAQQVDLLYKQAFGVTKTDTANNKSPSNESIPSPLLIRGDTQWVQSNQIPAIAAAVPDIVQAYTGANAVQMAADTTTVPVGGIYPTWKTNLTYWIPQEFGATYVIKIYVDNPGAANPTSTGTQIFAAGSGGTGEYYYNYQSGVLNFIGETIPAALTSGKVLYAVGYRYIGIVGVENLPANTSLGNLQISNTTISTTILDGNLIFAPNGNGQVTTTSSFTGSDFYGNNLTFGNLTLNLELSGNTANFNNVDVDDFIVSNSANLGNVGNVLIFGGTNGQFLQTDGNGELNWGSVSTSSISNGNSNLNIPTANGNIEMSVGGNANIVVVTSTGANINGYLNVTDVLDGNTANFTGNVVVPNLSVNAILSGNIGNFTGNITASNANLGNLVEANHVQTSLILNGNSNIGLASNGNVTVSVTGLGNVVEISNVGVNVVGYVYANGDGTFTAVKSNSVTSLSGNLELFAEQTGNSFIELKPFGNGTVDVANFRITSLATPNAASDAATKQYVDDVAQGLNVHDSCYAATANTLAILTGGGTISYNNGTSGVGANLVLSGSYTKDFTTANTFDGNTTAVANSRILVKSEANAAHNGIYIVSNATVLTRATDYNTVPEVEAGDFVFVEQGSTYNDSGWVQTTTVAIIGTDPIEFTQFSGAGTFQAGQGLTLTGTTFSVNVDNLTTEILAGNVVVKANAQLTTPNIGAATGTSLDLTGNLLANNVNSNNLVTTSNVQVTDTTITGNLTVNTAISGNTANFLGNVILPNLTVNLELVGNTANFSGNVITANLSVNASLVGNIANFSGNITAVNANLGNLVTANFVNVSSNIITNNLTVNSELSGNTANFSTSVQTPVVQNGNSNVGLVQNGNILFNITGTSNVLVLSSSGANLTGALDVSGNANVSNLNVTNEINGNTANLNSLNVDDLIVANTANLGNIGNITILGGSNGQFLQTNGNGVLNWGSVSSDSISNGNSNVSIPTVNGNVLISVNGTANILTVQQSGVSVSGILESSGNITGLNVIANNEFSSNKYSVGSSMLTFGNVTTSSITANQTIAEFPVAGFVGIQYLVRGIDAAGSKYSVATVQAVTDGTSVDYATYGSVNLGGATGVLVVNIVGSNVALQVTPSSTNNITWTTQYRLV